MTIVVIKLMFKLNHEFQKHWPLITALSILWLITIYFLVVSLNMNHGNFIYGLDDAYIHMAIAKNFALHGVWGVTQYEFSSASSSLLWTLLLSTIYFFIGPNIYVPFILNIILSSFTIFLVYYIVKSYKILPIYNLMILIGVIFFAPIPFLIFSGMETILQIILVLAFVYLSVQILTNDSAPKMQYYNLILLTIPLTMIRYESLILIFFIAILLFISKRYKLSLPLIGLAILPLTLYGVISIFYGGTFLPNSLILKSSLIEHYSQISTINFLQTAFIAEFRNIMYNPSLTVYGLISLSISAFRLIKNKTLWDTPTLWLIITDVLIFVEFMFTGSDYALRDSSYLFVLGIIGIIIGIYDYLPKKLIFKFNRTSIPRFFLIIILATLLISPFIINSKYSHNYPQVTNTKLYYLSNTPQETNNIYEQQYQMALFLNEYYTNDSIAANDIGAINYYNNIKCLDLIGLGSNDVAKAHENNKINQQELDYLANKHNVEIVMMYESPDIPPNWIKVGEWIIPHDVIVANDTVYFYATSSQYETNLIENLKQFSPKLPKDIIQKGIYTNS